MISRSSSVTSPSAEARLGPAAEIHHDLDQLGRIGQLANRLDDVRRQGGQEQAQVVDRLATAAALPARSTAFLLPVRLAYRRDESRFFDADDGLLHQQGHRGQVVEAGLLEAAVDRRFVGPDRRQHAVVRAAAALAPRAAR